MSVSSPPPVPAVSIPRAAAGRLSGKDHWPGTAHTLASGNLRAKGPTKILCSYAVAPSMM